MVSLEIIIVNWNSRHQLHDCLQSIVDADKPNFQLKQVTVVDNASEDDSLKDIEMLGLPLTLIKNQQNFGYAKAVNQGLQQSRADFILVLNPDTRLFKESLSKPIDFILDPAHQEVGILGVQMVDDHNQVTRACAYYPDAFTFFTHAIGLHHLFPRAKLTYFMRGWDHLTSREVDHVMGAFYLVRHEVFADIGNMDERFFMYYEELDFCLRAKQSGWKTFYFAEAKIYHKNGGVSEQVKAKRLMYSTRSRIKYAYKHFSWLGASLFSFGILFIAPIVRIGHAFARRKPLESVETVKAYVMLWRSFLWSIS